MSDKTLIDLETLGSPLNDSEGYNCYISEKGVQALPKKDPYGMIQDFKATGKYLCHFFMGGVAHYLFEKTLIDENGDVVKAHYADMSQLGNLPLPGSDSEPKSEPGENWDWGDVKTVTYFTKTNPEVSFSVNQDYASDSSRKSYAIENNITAVFSSAIICFKPKELGNLLFVKNPRFQTGEWDQIEDSSPLSVWQWRSGSPIPASGTLHNASYYVFKIINAASVGDRLGGRPVFDYKSGGSGFEFKDLMGYYSNSLQEDTTVIYDKFSREIKTVITLQRNEWYSWESFADSSNAQQFANACSHSYSIYFNASPRENFNAYSAPTTKVMVSKDGADPAYASPSTAVRPFSQLPSHAKICRWRHANKPPTGQWDVFNQALGSFVSFTIPLEGLALNSNPSIDDAMAYVDENVWNNQNCATPENYLFNGRVNGNRSGPNGECFSMWALGRHLFWESRDPKLEGNRVKIWNAGHFLMAQRNRLFSLGSDLLDGFPFTNDLARGFEGSIEVAGFNEERYPRNSTEVVENTGHYGGRFFDPERLFSFAYLEANIRNYHDYKLLYHGFDWQTSMNEDVPNIVYFSDVGDFRVNSTDSAYFAPSNVADKIIGLWGEDRTILTIGEKSMEAFNISDAAQDPVDFVRVEATYEQLVDWCGLGKLDAITKNHSIYQFNGVGRIRPGSLDGNSRLKPTTAIKGVKFDVIENQWPDGRKFYSLVDEKGREFTASEEALIYGISLKGITPVFASGLGGLWRALIDERNDGSFKVSFNYRVARNVLLRKMEIQTSVYDPNAAEAERTFRVWKDGILLRERKSRNLQVDFYGFSRGLSNRFTIECQGYLRAISVIDTEVEQKEAE